MAGELEALVREAKAEADRRAAEIEQREREAQLQKFLQDELWALITGDTSNEAATVLRSWASRGGISVERLIAGEPQSLDLEAGDLDFQTAVGSLGEFVEVVEAAMAAERAGGIVGLGRDIRGLGLLEPMVEAAAKFGGGATVETLESERTNTEILLGSLAEEAEEVRVLRERIGSSDPAEWGEAVEIVLPGRLESLDLGDVAATVDRSSLEIARRAAATAERERAAVEASNNEDLRRQEQQTASGRRATFSGREMSDADQLDLVERLIERVDSGPTALTRREAERRKLYERRDQLTQKLEISEGAQERAGDNAERDALALEKRQREGGALASGQSQWQRYATPKDPLDLSFLNDPEWQEMLGLATPSYNRGGYYGGSPRLSAAQQAEADRTEVQALLAEQFGGYAFFFEKNNAGLRVGIDANGKIVDHADPNAVSQKNVLDVIVDQGIVDPSRINGILQKTEWWQTTDSKMRFFDATFGELSEPGKQEFLEPITDLLAEEAEFLGFQLDPARARQMAETIARQGEENDQDFIRGLMVAESAFDAVGTEISEFAAARDSVQQMARQYFVPIGDEDAARFAEEIYVGDRTGEAMQQYFKEQAISRFPTLEAAITQQNITPEQYFAPYKYEIERMLDRPNVDILEEFADIIEYVPDTGGDNPRPMTLAETRKFIRGTNEWQASTQGQDQAQALAFAIGRTFGEDA